VQKLTPVADKIRDLRTRLGGVPYRVFLVRTRWSGGHRGRGVEEVLTAQELLPTPKVMSLDGQTWVLHSVGLDEMGDVRVADISPAYTEDMLMGTGAQGEPIPKDQQFFWEIVYPRPLPDAPVRRRYTPKSTPDYKPTRFGWSITLVKAGEERDRLTGLPQGD
jgi:hypothetical protein